MKILLIDDEQLDVFIAQKLLSLEFDTTGIASYGQALQWAKENHFDVVLIDYYLEDGKLGKDMLRELLAIKGKAFKPYLLTNYVDGQEYEGLKRDGFLAIIEKPLTLEKFKQQLQLS
ncbi:response regulator [Ohtaekwangia kribbensis]|jgi:CheY-like chemotaxis protein|uniref:Response regulator n=1 Tax=Ohtaekwangia kribbensis TaxID=688913 RepID=A0ABW3K1A0_9BACT